MGEKSILVDFIHIECRKGIATSLTTSYIVIVWHDDNNRTVGEIYMYLYIFFPIKILTLLPISKERYENPKILHSMVEMDFENVLWHY